MNQPSAALSFALDVATSAEAATLQTRRIATVAGEQVLTLEADYWQGIDELAAERGVTPDEVCRWVLENLSDPANLLRIFVLSTYRAQG